MYSSKQNSPLMKTKFSLLFLLLVFAHFSSAQVEKRSANKKTKQIDYHVDPNDVIITIHQDERRIVLSSPQQTIDSYFEYFNVLNHEDLEIMVYYGLVYTISIHENWVTVQHKKGDSLVWYFSSEFPAETYRLDKSHPNHFMNNGGSK
jgi:hypothetical protein